MTIQPQPAGSYNGNQGKDDYHRCISLSCSLSLSLCRTFRVCHPPAYPLASYPGHAKPLLPLLPSPLRQPLFKLNRSPALHFPLPAIEFDGGSSEYRDSIIIGVKLPIRRILRMIYLAMSNYTQRVIINGTSFSEIISPKSFQRLLTNFYQSFSSNQSLPHSRKSLYIRIVI